jgi:hypothetical protein
MATQITTVSVHPERAEELRRIRDEHDLASMDDALEEILSQRGE